MIMAVIGIDSHKDTLVGCLIDADERVVEHRDVPNSAHGHAELVTWAQTAGVERVGIEGSGNYGRPAAQALLAAGTTVVEVPPQMTAAARRGRRTGAKTDHIDALEIARITARDDDLPAPRCADAPDDLQCLVDYRRELVKDRTAAINRLHSALEKIRCGYHTSTGALTSPKGLDAASRLLRGDTTTRAEVARDRIAHIRRLNRHIDQLGARIATAVSQSGTSLTDIYGIGALTAAEIITETGDPCRYRTKARFAMANGTAPIEASSGRVVRHRLNRGGNRQLNKALHIAAIAQIRRPGTEGHAYYQRCLDRGKTKREATRALKRRISDRIWTHLQHDLQHTNPTPRLT